MKTNFHIEEEVKFKPQGKVLSKRQGKVRNQNGLASFIKAGIFQETNYNNGFIARYLSELG